MKNEVKQYTILIFDIPRRFILLGRCSKLFLEVLDIFSEVRNVEDKKLIYWFITLLVFVTPS